MASTHPPSASPAAAPLAAPGGMTYHAGLSALQERARAGTLDGAGLFASPEWLALTAEHVHPGKPLRIVEAREGACALWLPLLELGPGTLNPLSSWYNFTCAPLWEGAPDADRRRSLMDATAASLLAHAAHLSLAPLAESDALPLEAALQTAGWRVDRSLHHLNHWMALEGRSFDAVWADRPGALRETVRRKQHSLEVRILTGFDPNAWRIYEAVYADSWKPAEGHPVFLRALAEQEGARGTLRLGLAFHDGAPVAAQLWTLDRGTALIHKLAYRSDARPLSPGSVLTAAMMRQVIDLDRVDAIDFGTGDEPFKRDWMERTRPRWRLEALNPRAPRAWLPLARRAAKGLVARAAEPYRPAR